MTTLIKLFCIPHAGGMTSIYNEWKPIVGLNVELIPIELAGRGTRFLDEHYKSFDQAVDDVVAKILNHNKIEQKFAIYGHSMGAYIAYEAVQILNKLNDNRLVHLFVSGKGAPYLTKKEFISDWSDEELIKKIDELGGLHNRLKNNRELLNLFIPVIRNDYRIIETYNHNIKNKVETKMTVISGKYDESISMQEILGWKEYSDKEVDIFQINGGHFFINENAKEVIKIIKEKLLLK
ncbi:thioesterase domain-containing protein [Bacillus vallismortis]|nr:thioesterase domain-containing protein [Bacillus vallismortis]